MTRIVFWIRFAVRGLILAAVLFGVGFIVFVSSIERGPGAAPPRADGIVVLTGGQARISEAVRLLAAGKAKRLLISGVHETTTRDELSRRDPTAAHLFQCCIDLDRRAQNTTDNATETRTWAGDQGFASLIVVTSSYHMPRTLVELERVMPRVTLMPHAVVPDSFKIDSWWAYPGTLRLLFLEYLKYIPALARLGATRIMGEGEGEPPDAARRAAAQSGPGR
ncbi:MAG: YdcF family protein [Methyloligellaceae bacterium]